MQEINSSHLELVLKSTNTLEELMQRKLKLCNESLHFQLDELEGNNDDDDYDYYDEERPSLPTPISKSIRFIASVRNTLLHDAQVNELTDEAGYRKAVHFVRQHLEALPDQLSQSDVASSRSRVGYSSKRLSALARILPYAKSMETSLETRFNATGRGLGSKLESITDSYTNPFSESVVEVIQRCSEARNGLLYDPQYSPQDAHDHRYAAVEESLRRWTRKEFNRQKERDIWHEEWAKLTRRAPVYALRVACIVLVIAAVLFYKHQAQEARRVPVFRREWELGELLLVRDHVDVSVIRCAVSPAARYVAMVTIPKDSLRSRSLEMWEVGRGKVWTMHMRPYVSKYLSIGFSDIHFDGDGSTVLVTVGGTTSLITTADGRLLNEFGVPPQSLQTISINSDDARGMIAARFLSNDQILTVGAAIDIRNRQGDLIRSRPCDWTEYTAGDSPSVVDVASSGAVAIGIQHIRDVVDSLNPNRTNESITGNSLVCLMPDGVTIGPFRTDATVDDLQFSQTGRTLVYCCGGEIGKVDLASPPTVLAASGTNVFDHVECVRDSEYIFAMQKYDSIDVLTESSSHSRVSDHQVKGDTNMVVDFSVNEHAHTMVIRFPNRTEVRRLLFTESKVDEKE